ncbi:MAG: extracellular solute-binding protein [Lachnospiraceae bacterium]|jgi:raffinose/stachyose/melibiose transport system substrate-binding protein|nr:extracellular solute-binding protein [Lachnospiraceae bacterium]
MKKNMKKFVAVFIAGALIVMVSACGKEKDSNHNLVKNEKEEKKVVTMFTPMGKADANADNIARFAQEKTVISVEKKLNLYVDYRSYTADDYKDKTYDEVLVDRAHNNMDDMYLMNSDSIKLLGGEGALVDLSSLSNVKNLREVVKTANTVNGKLVAIPQEIVAYGLFVNKDMFDKYKLELPETPEDLLECCKVFKENGIKTPIGANRWWLECFVFAQAYADMYNGNDTEAEIEALNSGKAKYSDYMRSGFEYLKKMMDLGYIDAKTAYMYEAIDGEGPDFMAQKTPIVMAYWGAANAETAYGNPDFNLQVIGFPSSLGQMPLLTLTGYGIGKKAEHLEDAMKVLDEMVSDESLQMYADQNKVISPSKNVEVKCIDALKPLNDKINEGVYVLASNANMEVEQWGNTCIIVRKLLGGATVEECMAEFDKLQGVQ